MDPSNKEAAGGALPPSVEQPVAVPVNGGAGEKAPNVSEQSPISGERAPSSAMQPPATTIPLPLPNQPTITPPASSNGAPAQAPILSADDDSDLIEKEWVDKAKQIVERTRDDPHRQSEQLTVFKADYLKKRYGKTIKVSQ